MQTAIGRQELKALLLLSSECPEGPSPGLLAGLRENDSTWGSHPTLCTDGDILSQWKKIKTSCYETTLI